MDINKALGLLGRPGAYSTALYCLMFAMNMFASFNHVSLASLYGIPIQHKCSRGITSTNAASVVEVNNSSSGHQTNGMLQHQCFSKVGNETIKCAEWTFSYPHGIAKTWINEFKLVCEKKHLISLSTSIYMAGVMFGSILIGQASDRYGRRPILLICISSASTLCLIMAFIPNLIALMIIRFFLGFFIAGVHGVVYIFPTEITPKKYANIGSVAVLNSFIFGALIGCLVSWLMKDWRMVQIALSIPGFLCFLVAYLFLPESPRWCLSNQKHEKFQIFFKKAIKFNKLKGTVLEDMNSCLTKKDEQSPTSAIKKKRYSTVDVFRTPKIRKRSLIGIYLWFTAGVSYYALVLNIRTLNDNPFLAVLIAASTDVATYVLAFFYVPWLGKRKSLIGILFIGGICSVVYKFYNSLVILLIGKAFIAVSFGMVFIYLPEIYPTVIRNTGVGTLSLFARLGSVLAPQVVLLGSYTSFDVPVVIVGSLSIVAGFLTIFAPETKDRMIPDTIEEIEKKRPEVLVTDDVTEHLTDSSPKDLTSAIPLSETIPLSDTP